MQKNNKKARDLKKIKKKARVVFLFKGSFRKEEEVYKI